MADLAGLVGDFETAELIANPEAHAEYLDNLQKMLERMALMARQDADLAYTWLGRRRPKKGRRVPWRDRIRLSRRTRGHGRHIGDSLMQAVVQVKKWRDVHEQFMELERKQAKEQEEESDV